MVTRLSWALSLLLALAKEEASPSADSQISGAGCPYFHQTACAAEPFKTFLQEWQEKTRCWLCDNRQLVTRARSVLQDLLYIQRPELPQVGQEGSLHPEWKETCVAAWILALFASTRSQAVQPWSFYEIGLSLIMGCAFEEATFFELYGITPSQVAYNFYVLGLPYHRPNPVLHIQEAELGTAERLRKPEDAPLVIDIGMGLGADSRYFLSQGFRVVAVEANRRAIEVAMTIDWVKPLVLEGQLVFLHAAVAPPGGGGSTTTVYAFDDRPEQSNAQAWVEEVGGVATSVRTIECADLLRLFGQAVYMKIDVESSTIDCLDSLVQSQRDAPGRQPVLPKFLSMELEAASLFNPFHRKLKELGYLFYKACRQYVYSPSPCEQGRYSREVPGCGSGPFGVAAVDYLRGLRWSPIDELPTDTQWVEEFEKGIDWFDLHAMRVA